MDYVVTKYEVSTRLFVDRVSARTAMVLGTFDTIDEAYAFMRDALQDLTVEREELTVRVVEVWS